MNLLPDVDEDDMLLIKAIANAEDLEIFKTKVVQDVINYKWGRFASNIHWFGWIIHIIYIVVLQIYISTTYLGIVVPGAGSA